MERVKQQNIPKEQRDNGKIKRSKALKVLAFLLAVAYVSIVGFGFVFSWNISKVWCSFFIVLAGVYLIARGLFFHLDSNYLLGLVFFSLGAFSGVNFFVGLALSDVIYFSLIGFSFLAVYFIFRQNIYIISFALSCLEVLLLVINKFLLSIVTFILLQAMLVALVFVVFLTVTKIKREKNSAVSN